MLNQTSTQEPAHVYLQSLWNSSCTHEAETFLQELLTSKEEFRFFAVSWANLLLGFIHEKLGDRAIFEVNERLAEGFCPKVVQEWVQGGADPENFPAEDVMRQRVRTWTMYHECRVQIDEDGEKFILTLDPCTTGGKLIAKHEAQSRNRMEPIEGVKDISQMEGLAVLNHPYLWTAGIKNLPVFCQHCLQIWEIGPAIRTGFPIIVFEPPKNAKEPCVQRIYKKPSHIPLDVLTRYK